MLHPVVLLALALWWLNDHLLKHSMPGALVGKLSDVACLIVLPVMALTLAEWFTPQMTGRSRARWLISAGVFAACTMVCINLWAPAAWVYEHGMGVFQWPLQSVGQLMHGQGLRAPVPVQLTMDAGDAWTAPCAFLPLLLLRLRRRKWQRELRPISPQLRPTRYLQV